MEGVEEEEMPRGSCCREAKEMEGKNRGDDGHKEE